ncbi:type II toxin-antitoxin system VapC family toxin [uncultured Brevundimonas sp.]|uniref:type II toxin-antitoxin system VapC family toxin n=1 Tax=uncultured Brevundimonas sp. TaxID=213418 RepID=UPI0025DF9FAA|nr:type II toxin-antitoxin system VapC family toxin [uncultured Brevundimonas sp.]
MNVLIDTQILIWSLFKDARLSDRGIELVDLSDKVFVSVASIYEIDFKRRDPKRLRASDSLLQRMPNNMPANLPRFGFTLLPINAEVSWRAARLPFDHGDPWDRIIVAQALELDVPLVSADKVLLRETEAHARTRGLIVF